MKYILIVFTLITTVGGEEHTAIYRVKNIPSSIECEQLAEYVELENADNFMGFVCLGKKEDE